MVRTAWQRHADEKPVEIDMQDEVVVMIARWQREAIAATVKKLQAAQQGEVWKQLEQESKR